MNITLSSIKQVTIEEIARDLFFYFQQVEAGETLVVTRTGHLIAAIQPIAQDSTELRPVGLCAGMFRVPDDFDAALPEDMLAAFEGK